MRRSALVYLCLRRGQGYCLWRRLWDGYTCCSAAFCHQKVIRARRNCNYDERSCHQKQLVRAGIRHRAFELGKRGVADSAFIHNCRLQKLGRKIGLRPWLFGWPERLWVFWWLGCRSRGWLLRVRCQLLRCCDWRRLDARGWLRGGRDRSRLALRGCCWLSGRLG